MPTLEELERELADLAERQRVTAGLVEALRAYEQTIGRKVTGGESGVTIRHRSPPTRSAPAMEATERAAVAVMEREGGPVQTGMVVEEMRSRGMDLPDVTPVNTISARLSNNPKFKGRRGKGYWFADRPWPGDPDPADDNVIEQQPSSTDATEEREEVEAPIE